MKIESVEINTYLIMMRSSSVLKRSIFMLGFSDGFNSGSRTNQKNAIQLYCRRFLHPVFCPKVLFIYLSVCLKFAVKTMRRTTALTLCTCEKKIGTKVERNTWVQKIDEVTVSLLSLSCRLVFRFRSLIQPALQKTS